MTLQGELRWGVKASFLRYVRVIAAGTVSLDQGVGETPEGDFTWPLARVSRTNGQLELSFTGSVRFTAHGGFLDVDLRDPVLRLTGTGGTLDFTDVRDGLSKTVAVIGGTDVGPDRDSAAGRAEETGAGTEDADALVPHLTAHGVDLFGGVYPEGTAFDALVARMPALTG